MEPTTILWFILAAVAVLLFLPKLINIQKVNKIIDKAQDGGLSKEAITILLARDATHSLGRVLTDRELQKIWGMVERRYRNSNAQKPANPTADVQAVFQYLNQTATPFLLQKGEKIVNIIP